MKRKLSVLSLIFLIVSFSPCLKADDIAIIEDIKIDLIREAPEIKIASNIPVEYVDYTLDSPSRIIIDPLGVVYSNLNENIFSGQNLVQSVSIVKARGEVPSGLDRSYYPLDFIIIELSKTVRYDILHKEKLVVRLGEEIMPEKPVVVGRPQVIERTDMEQADVEIMEVEGAEGEEWGPGREFFDEEKFPMVERYRIEPGDELEISVWQHPDLLRKVVVRPDGYISFPLAGEVNVSGLTANRTAKQIALRLSRILRKPEVSVIVTSFASKSIFVLGAVNKPGLYPYKTRTTVLKAVSQADSWQPHAYIKCTLVVKKFFTGETEVIRVNLWDIVKDGKVDMDVELQPGDIVYVPQSFIGNIGTFIDGLRVGISTGATYSID